MRALITRQLPVAKQKIGFVLADALSTGWPTLTCNDIKDVYTPFCDCEQILGVWTALAFLVIELGCLRHTGKSSEFRLVVPQTHTLFFEPTANIQQ